MRKLALCVVAALSTFAFAPAANAIIISCTPEAGSGGICTPPGPGDAKVFFEFTSGPSASFSTYYDLLYGADGVVDSSAITVKINGGIGVIFESIFYNDVPFDITPAAPGPGDPPLTAVQSAVLATQPVIAGTTARITVNGRTTQTTGQYTGNIAFGAGAVPEPSTWALMLMGFGAVGYSLRRRPKYRLIQAV